MDSESPWRSSLQQLRRNRAAMIALGVLLFMVVVTLLAPLYAHDIATTTPSRRTSRAASRSATTTAA